MSKENGFFFLVKLLTSIVCMDLLSRFNKTREHFPTLKDYNDYLEEVEDMSELFSPVCKFVIHAMYQLVET